MRRFVFLSSGRQMLEACFNIHRRLESHCDWRCVVRNVISGWCRIQWTVEYFFSLCTWRLWKLDGIMEPCGISTESSLMSIAETLIKVLLNTSARGTAALSAAAPTSTHWFHLLVATWGSQLLVVEFRVFGVTFYEDFDLIVIRRDIWVTVHT